MKNMTGAKSEKHRWQKPESRRQAKARNTTGDHMMIGGFRPPFTTWLAATSGGRHDVVIHHVVSYLFGFSALRCVSGGGWTRKRGSSRQR